MPPAVHGQKFGPSARNDAIPDNFARGRGGAAAMAFDTTLGTSPPLPAPQRFMLSPTSGRGKREEGKFEAPKHGQKNGPKWALRIIPQIQGRGQRLADFRAQGRLSLAAGVRGRPTSRIMSLRKPKTAADQGAGRGLRPPRRASGRAGFQLGAPISVNPERHGAVDSHRRLVFPAATRPLFDVEGGCEIHGKGQSSAGQHKGPLPTASGETGASIREKDRGRLARCGGGNLASSAHALAQQAISMVPPFFIFFFLPPVWCVECSYFNRPFLPFYAIALNFSRCYRSSGLNRGFKFGGGVEARLIPRAIIEPGLEKQKSSLGLSIIAAFSVRDFHFFLRDFAPGD